MASSAVAVVIASSSSSQMNELIALSRAAIAFRAADVSSTELTSPRAMASAASVSVRVSRLVT
jgi:hypothetical protein